MTLSKRYSREFRRSESIFGSLLLGNKEGYRTFDTPYNIMRFDDPCMHLYESDYLRYHIWLQNKQEHPVYSSSLVPMLQMSQAGRSWNWTILNLSSNTRYSGNFSNHRHPIYIQCFTCMVYFLLRYWSIQSSCICLWFQASKLNHEIPFWTEYIL